MRSGDVVSEVLVLGGVAVTFVVDEVPDVDEVLEEGTTGRLTGGAGAGRAGGGWTGGRGGRGTVLGSTGAAGARPTMACTFQSAWGPETAVNCWTSDCW